MQDLPREERLRGRKIIARIFAEANQVRVGKIAARALPNSGGKNRLAAVAGKSLGGAVLRNRLRRRLRAAYRLQKDGLPGGCDLVLMARPGLAEATWRDVMRSVAAVTEQAIRAASGGPRPPRPRD